MKKNNRYWLRLIPLDFGFYKFITSTGLFLVGFVHINKDEDWNEMSKIYKHHNKMSRLVRILYE